MKAPATYNTGGMMTVFARAAAAACLLLLLAS
jgi:hypothetical protein